MQLFKQPQIVTNILSDTETTITSQSPRAKKGTAAITLPQAIHIQKVDDCDLRREVKTLRKQKHGIAAGEIKTIRIEIII